MSRQISPVAAKVRPLWGAAFGGLALGTLLSLHAAVAAPAVVPGADPGAQSPTPLLQRVAVFGSDERVPTPQSHWAVAAKVGVIYDPRSHSVCTAFCVAPDTVATAAHCLYRTGDEPPLRLSDILVRLHGTHETSHIAGAAQGAPEPNVLAGSTRLKVRPPIDATHDWALVRLARPLCKGGALKLSRRPVKDVMRLARAGRVYNIAYHRDIPKWWPMMTSHCRVGRSFADVDWPTIRHDFANPGQLLLHTCDTGGASSGSPLLIDGPHGAEVVGINVGTYVQSKVIMLNGEVVHRFRSDDVANTGVNSLAFAGALDAFKAAHLLASSGDVRRLQKALAAKGLYTGPQDGRFGPALHAAIESFERASAMQVRGLATRSLLHALSGESAVVTGRIPENGRAGAQPPRP